MTGKIAILLALTTLSVVYASLEDYDLPSGYELLGRGKKPYHEKGDHSWDFFLLVSRWPGSVCYDVTDPPPACDVPKWSNDFALHGMWPNRDDGSWPQFCDNSDPFDLNQIKDLEDEMRQYWTDYYKPTAGSKFWTHEWDKHGTCSKNVFPTQHDYFQAVLDTRKSLDIKSLFAEHDIVPSNDATYSLDKMRTILKEAFGVAPEIGCTRNHHHQEIFLTANFCLDKELKPFKCNQGLAQRFALSCRDDEVYFPEVEYGDNHSSVVASSDN